MYKSFELIKMLIINEMKSPVMCAGTSPRDPTPFDVIDMEIDILRKKSTQWHHVGIAQRARMLHQVAEEATKVPFRFM